MIDMSTKPPSYRSEIDGLRAFAVLVVIIFHAKLLPIAGFIGVDVFFVISGFVVTRSIANSVFRGDFSIVQFFLRRLRRLYPALLATMTGSTLLGILFFLPKEAIGLAKANLSQLVFASNIYFWKTGSFGYFGDPPEEKPTLHLWSLAMEEQFYIALPTALVCIVYTANKLRISPKRLVFIAILLGFCYSLGYGCRELHYRPFYTFYTLRPRAWEFVAGALFVFIPPISKKTVRNMISTLGAFMIVWPLLTYTSRTPFPGANAISPCVGTALLIWGCDGTDNWIGNVLKSKVCVHTGRLSYSLYLWHWPLLATYFYVGAEAAFHKSWLPKLLLLVVIFAVSTVSFYVLEEPIRKRRYLSSDRQLLSVLLVSITLLALAWGHMVAGKGYPWRWPSRALAYAQPTVDHQFQVECRTSSAPIPTIPKSSKERPSYILWGDSHAMTLAPILGEIASRLKCTGLQITRSDTPPLFIENYQGGYSQDPNILGEVVASQMKKTGVQHVIIHSRWTISKRQDFDRHLLRTVHRLQQECSAVVWIVGPVPQYDVAIPRALAIQEVFPSWKTMEQTPLQHQHRFHEFYSAVEKLKGTPNFHILDPQPYFVNADGFLLTGLEGVSYYSDPHHLAQPGARRLLPAFENMLLTVKLPRGH